MLWQSPQRWHPQGRPILTSLPFALRPWLFDHRSLTKRLRQHAQGQLRVELRQHYWGKPSASEAQCLGIPRHQYARIREVTLLGKNQPWVFARTILPLGSLRGGARRLHHIGNRSLGEFLFRDRSLKRQPIEVSALSFGNTRLFARRSTFVYHDQGILVAECFTAEFMASL